MRRQSEGFVAVLRQGVNRPVDVDVDFTGSIHRHFLEGRLGPVCRIAGAMGCCHHLSHSDRKLSNSPQFASNQQWYCLGGEDVV